MKTIEDVRPSGGAQRRSIESRPRLMARIIRPRYVLAAAAFGAAIVLAISPKTAPTKSPETPGQAPRVPVVRVATVIEAGTTREARLSGTTRSRQRAEVSFQVGGRVLLRAVDLGDAFRKGDLLARLDSRSYDLAVAAAEARLAEVEVRLAQAQRQRSRTMRLVEKKAATSEEMEAVTAEVEALEASRNAAVSLLDEARRLASDTAVLAPFDGVVSDVMIQPGEYAAAGRPVFRLNGNVGIEVEVEVPESLIPHLKPGDRMRVAFPAIDRAAEGTIRSLGRTAGGEGRLFPLVVSLPDRPWLMPGLSAEVVVGAESVRRPAVPAAAVRAIDGESPSVLRVRNERLEAVEVQVFGFADGRVIVSSEIEEGDLVVVSSHAGLTAGSRVEIRR